MLTYAMRGGHAERGPNRGLAGCSDFSQTNSATSLAEPDFYNGSLAQQLTSQFGEPFTLATGPILPLDNDPGDATALKVRLGGGAPAVHLLK